MNYLSNLVQNLDDYKPKVDLFPRSNPKQVHLLDSDIPDCVRFVDLIDDTLSELEFEEDDTRSELEFVAPRRRCPVAIGIERCDWCPVATHTRDEGIDISDESDDDMGDETLAMNKADAIMISSEGEILTIESGGESDLDVDIADKCVICEYKPSSHQIQSEMEKFMKLQEAGLGSSFKCPKCRSCKECRRGPGKELISMQMEAEQELIKDSIRIDIDEKRAFVLLAFTADPEIHLKKNMP